MYLKKSQIQLTGQLNSLTQVQKKTKSKDNFYGEFEFFDIGIDFVDFF